MTFFADYFKEMYAQFGAIPPAELDAVVARLAAVTAQGKKVILVGNGGSAAMAAHVAVDLTKAAGIRAVTFNEADLLTCFANDYGYENWVTEALKAYADAGDLVVLISSSGKSPNITNGAKQARAMGLGIVTLSGFAADNPLRKLGDINFYLGSDQYGFVEVGHLAICHAILDFACGQDVPKG